MHKKSVIGCLGYLVGTLRQASALHQRIKIEKQANGRPAGREHLDRSCTFTLYLLRCWLHALTGFCREDFSRLC